MKYKLYASIDGGNMTKLMAEADTQEEFSELMDKLDADYIRWFVINEDGEFDYSYRICGVFIKDVSKVIFSIPGVHVNGEVKTLRRMDDGQ